MANASTKKAEDYVISTGKQYSVRQFVDKVLKELEMPMTWEGEGINERGYIINEKGEKNIIIKIDKKYFRPAEVENLLGDSTKAEKKLGWKPKISFDELVKEMVKEDLEIAKKEKIIDQKYNINESHTILLMKIKKINLD